MTCPPEDDGSQHELRPQTRLITAGREPFDHFGFVNTPVYHGSTVLSKTAADYLAHRGRYQYGRRGNPNSESLESALRDLEGPNCAGVSLLPSGLAAISFALLSALKAGDHVLVSDSAYGPTRKFCDTVLSRYGIEASYYDPRAGDAIAAQMRDNTRAVFVEAPGSLSFEMQDVPAIAAAAHARGAVVLMDNTWATPLNFRPLDHGVDLSIQAGTKYIGGHSDIMFGVVAANAGTWRDLQHVVGESGICVGPDDMFLALRGLRTLAVRLERHYASGLAVARWLAARPEVARVLHPGLEDDPGHALFRRDFSGGCGLFAFVFKTMPEKAMHAFIDALTLFGIGASWGGYESLAIPFDCAPLRTVTHWTPGGPTVRLHIGLEDVGDLIADLERGFAAIRTAE
jgi:cysteine-S-conjugate beta-lyase